MGTITCEAVVAGHAARGIFRMLPSVTMPAGPFAIVHYKVANPSGKNMFVHQFLQRDAARNVGEFPFHRFHDRMVADHVLQRFLLELASRGALQEPADEGIHSPLIKFPKSACHTPRKIKKNPKKRPVTAATAVAR